MQWYFQCSPHDVRDWDATQTVMLFEGVIEGRSRKLAAQFSRNGWLFILDRTTGKPILSEALHYHIQRLQRYGRARATGSGS